MKTTLFCQNRLTKMSINLSGTVFDGMYSYRFIPI